MEKGEKVGGICCQTLSKLKELGRGRVVPNEGFQGFHRGDWVATYVGDKVRPPDQRRSLLPQSWRPSGAASLACSVRVAVEEAALVVVLSLAVFPWVQALWPLKY